jgi:hypothetical protein
MALQRTRALAVARVRSLPPVARLAAERPTVRRHFGTFPKEEQLCLERK